MKDKQKKLEAIASRMYVKLLSVLFSPWNRVQHIEVIILQLRSFKAAAPETYLRK